MGSCAEKIFEARPGYFGVSWNVQTMDVSAVIPPSTAARKTEQIDQQGWSYRVCLPTLG